VTGLHLVEKPRNSDSRWYVYAWRGGPCIHKAEGTKPIITPDILAAGFAAQQKNFGKAADTLDCVINGYQSSPEYTRLAASTQRDYRLWLTRISEKFGPAPLGAFEDLRMRKAIMDWRDTWSHQPRTADKATVMLATLLGWAFERGMLSVNVAAKIRQLHHVNKSDEVWEDRHWLAMQNCPPHLLQALKVASLTGLRLGDLVKLDWAHVGEKAIIIVTAKRKGRAVVPILPELRAILATIPHRDGAVLRNTRGSAWTESGLGSVFQKAKPVNFDRTMHDLRGTYATWLAIKGLTDQEIARIIGWTAHRVSEIRARYVDEARVIISLVERLSD
jgi:integrase